MVVSDDIPDLACSNRVSKLVHNLLAELLDAFDCRCRVIVPYRGSYNELEITECVVHGKELGLKQIKRRLHTSSLSLHASFEQFV